MLPELFTKLSSSGFEEFDIGFAIGLHFSLHDKVVIVINLLLIPTFEFSFLLGRHAIWIIHFFGWHGSFVMLVFLHVEFVREETLHSSVILKVRGNWPEETAGNTGSL